jgi:hypothetical protein
MPMSGNHRMSERIGNCVSTPYLRLTKIIINYKVKN